VSVLAARHPWWRSGSGAAGHPARGRCLDLVRVAWEPGNGRESKRFVLAGYVNRKCVLVTGLTGVLARPTGGLYMCKYVPVRKIIVILKGAMLDVDFFLEVTMFDCNS
jgi:hypothetical protein